LAFQQRKVIKIGKVLHKSPIAKNIIIGRINTFVEEGTIVYDKEAKKIGAILEIFGPVNKPYARIKVDDIKISPDEPIFIIEGDKKAIKWRKMPKNKRKFFKKR